MPVGEISISRIGLISAANKQLADKRQIFTEHDDLVGPRVPKIMQALATNDRSNRLRPPQGRFDSSPFTPLVSTMDAWVSLLVRES